MVWVCEYYSSEYENISKYFKLLLNSIEWCGLNEEYPNHTKNFEWVQRGSKTDDECEDEFLSMYVWAVL